MKNTTIWIIIIIVLALITWAIVHKAQAPVGTEPTTAPVELTPTTAPTTSPATTPAKTTVSNSGKNSVMMKDGMKIETTQEGAGPAITNGQTAVVNYVGKLADGKVFDASANHGDGTFPFQLGAGVVIKGWDEGVLGMKVGETRILTIPPELGYGANGYPPVIPQNATLTFEVTLKAIK